jgi:CRP/FNR family transcriptional regulator, dissimilatory nitrate respiration regulator
MDYGVLLGSPIFRGIDLTVLELLIMNINYRVKSYQAEAVIALRGEEVNSLIIVLSGLVRGEMVDLSGRVLKIEDIPVSRVLAPAFIFGSSNRYPVNVIAVNDSELLIIDKRDFVQLLRSNDKVLINYLDTISNRSQFLSDKIRFLTFKTIKAKLAHYILEEAGTRLYKIRLGKTQKELSDYFGIARPSLARTLRELDDEGYIIAEGKNITIVNREGLSALTLE